MSERVSLDDLLARQEKVCPRYWGSHGCDLGRHHEDQDQHVCGVNDPDGLCSVVTRTGAGYVVQYSYDDGLTLDSLDAFDPLGSAGWSAPEPCDLRSVDDLSTTATFTETPPRTPDA